MLSTSEPRPSVNFGGGALQGTSGRVTMSNLLILCAFLRTFGVYDSHVYPYTQTQESLLRVNSLQVVPR